MSKDYREHTQMDNPKLRTDGMRIFCQRPGRTNENGDPIYVTEQHHKNECDINQIIRKYDKTGLITHITKFEAKFGDMTGTDFKTAHDQVIKAQAMFDELPSQIRKRFQNTPEKLLSFMENPENRKEAEELGLINPMWTEETDGIGEHVKQGEQEIKDKYKQPEEQN